MLALGGAYDVLKRKILVLGARNELVQVVHVGLMVVAVVVFESFGRDVRAQRWRVSRPRVIFPPWRRSRTTTAASQSRGSPGT